MLCWNYWRCVLDVLNILLDVLYKCFSFTVMFFLDKMLLKIQCARSKRPNFHVSQFTGVYMSNWLVGGKYADLLRKGTNLHRGKGWEKLDFFFFGNTGRGKNIIFLENIHPCADIIWDKNKIILYIYNSIDIRYKMFNYVNDLNTPSCRKTQSWR